ATASYGLGAADGPAAILQASHQVELYDIQTGRPYVRGIHMLPIPEDIRAKSVSARRLFERAAESADTDREGAGAKSEVDALCAEVHESVYQTVVEVLTEGRLPGVVGGDHSVALGAIRAVAEHHPGVGILQVDAHADLRVAYQGYRYSHASIMDNALREAAGVDRLVQVGVRDLCESDLRAAAEDPRIIQHHDVVWRRRLAGGEALESLLRDVVEALPDEVYVSFDIDGLDPALCPGTGTPVPGGLLFHEARLLLQTVVESGRRIVGFDLSEVAPGADQDEWDGNVGARILYSLIGFALLSDPQPSS
ncbi:MAG: agmatinase family protein, partial [Planctomycetota bacterium]|nr:agmatinase family protein [Planctomycetota bacterium]